jgi:hypothetical protein
VDSLDRYSGGIPRALSSQTTSSDWTTQFQQNVLYGYFTRLAITQIQMVYNLPTIVSGYNDTFKVAGPGGSKTLTIPQGFYDVSGLSVAMQAALNAPTPGGFGAGAFTVVYSALSRSFQITGNAGNFVVLPPNLNDKPTVRFLTTSGLYSNTGGAIAASKIFSPPSMLATRFVDLVSRYLTKYQRVKDSTTLQSPTISNIIARIYLTPPNTLQSVDSLVFAQGSAPFTLCIDYNTPKHIKWSPDEALGNFDLQLVDDFGQLIPYSPSGAYGCEYQFTMLATET